MIAPREASSWRRRGRRSNVLPENNLAYEVCDRGCYSGPLYSTRLAPCSVAISLAPGFRPTTVVITQCWHRRMSGRWTRLFWNVGQTRPRTALTTRRDQHAALVFPSVYSSRHLLWCFCFAFLLPPPYLAGISAANVAGLTIKLLPSQLPQLGTFVCFAALRWPPSETGAET